MPELPPNVRSSAHAKRLPLPGGFVHSRITPRFPHGRATASVKGMTRFPSAQNSCRSGGIIHFACLSRRAPSIGRAELTLALTAAEFSSVCKKDHDWL
jgi:hypothetical protein